LADRLSDNAEDAFCFAKAASADAGHEDRDFAFVPVFGADQSRLPDNVLEEHLGVSSKAELAF